MATLVRPQSEQREQDVGETSPPEPGTVRRYVWTCAVATALAAVLFTWLVTDESLNLFRSLPFSNFYDVQARALLHGHFSVPSSVLWIEGFRIGGRTYMYYGPFPALLRIPVLLFTHRLDGRLTEISMILAFVVALVAVSRLSWKVRLLIRGSGEVRWGEAILGGAWTAVVGLGSVLFFLGSNIQVYYEAELWGAALALCAFDAIVGFVMRPSIQRIAAAGLLATFAMMTRGSVGAGPVAALGLLALGHGVLALLRRVPISLPNRWRRGGQSSSDPARAERPERSEEAHRWQWIGISGGQAGQTRFAALAAAAAVPVALYAVVNEIKFRTLFRIPFTHQAFEQHNPKRLAVLAANHGSLFGLEYIPTALVAYLRPDALRFTRLFPFVAFPGPATVIGHAVYDTLDWASSVPTTMPVLFVAALVGVVVMLSSTGPWKRLVARRGLGHGRPRAEAVGIAPGLAALWAPLVGAAIGTIGVLTISYIAIRYLADIVPFVVLLCLVGFHATMRRLPSMRRLFRSGLYTAVVVLAVFGIWVNLGLALVYQRQLEPNIPTTTRAQLVSFEARVDSALFGSTSPPVRLGRSLPKTAPVGALAIVGTCAGLYQFDGTQWFGVEIGARGGAIGLHMTFPRGRLFSRQPVIVVGAAPHGEVLAVQQMPGNMVRFSYRSLIPGQPWYNGFSFRPVPGRSYHVVAYLDARVQQITTEVDGATELELISAIDNYFYYPVTAPGPVQLGTGAGVAGVSPRFHGVIARVPVTTPICSSFLSRLRR